MLFLSFAVVQAFSSDVSTIEDTPPSISRNPFVSGPQGRIIGATGKTGRNKRINISNKTDKSNKPGKLEDVKVTGVLLDNNDAMALLGNQVVKIGDMVHEFIVIDITRVSVTLSNGERILKLFINNN